MLTFETRLKKLKYLVLKEAVQIIKEGNNINEALNEVPFKIIKGDIAEYRCCVYKERAIVLERTKLALGYLPSGCEDSFIGDLIPITEDNQVIYVIPAACDKCPIDRYTVTDVCRECIQHKCIESCPVGAVTRAGGRAYINQELCKECGMCKKSCPFNAIVETERPCKRSCPTGALAIDEKSKHAIIKQESCTNCGACMAGCPFGAISDKSLIAPVAKALVEKENIYAVVAPSIAGQFGPKVTVGQIKIALKKLGFVDVVEAACGADAVTVHESHDFIQRIEKGDKYMTNSCCPGFLSYIEKKFPSQVGSISKTVSPMIATGRMIKKKDSAAIVVFIGPCTAKKVEATRAGLEDAVDYVLTFEEIAALLGGFDIEPEECENVLVEDASVFGRGFAQGGGLTAAIENYVKEKSINIDFKPIKVSGKIDIKKTMTMAKTGRLSGNFIEGMMCEGGCIGGPATMVSAMKAKKQLDKFSSEASKKTVLQNDSLSDFEGIELEIPVK